MQTATKAFILSYLKYGDTSIIIKTFAQKFGFKSFIINGFYSSKSNQKTALIYPLNEVEIMFNPNSKSQLIQLLSLQNSNTRYTLSTQISKSALLLFLSEILVQCLQDENENLSMYNFLCHSLDNLNKSTSIPFFHLNFLLEFTSYLGFYPSSANYKKGTYFNLKEGDFTHDIQNTALTLNDTELWYYFINAKKNYTCNKIEKYLLLDMLLAYYSCHLSHFKKPKSLEILREVFD